MECEHVSAGTWQWEYIYKVLVEQANDGLYIIGLHTGKILFSNLAFARMFGYTTEELEGTRIEDIHLQEDRRRMKNALRRVHRGEEVVEEFWFETRSGEWVCIEMKPGLMELAGNQFIACVARDITERKRTEQALRKSEERFRDLYEHAPTAYFSVDMNGRIQLANRAAEQLLGYARDSLTDRPVFDLYADTPSGKEKAQRLNQRIRAGEEICDEELEMRKFDGSSVWINLTVQLIRDERGRLLERRAIVVDVTERKRADEALRESERRVRELASASVRAHEEERQWAALEVHDRIAQSLVSVFHQLQGLQFMTRTDPRVHPVVQRSSTLLQEAIRESQNIMNDLYPAGLDEFGVVPLMEAELSRFQEDTGCRVSFNADSGVMPSQEVEVTLYRIFHEALTNIQRHAPGAQNVVVSLTYREMFVSLEIQDDGPGFDMEAVTEDNRIGGLMSMQRRAEIIGGSFEVTSKPGEGTVVTISVPIESA